MPFQDGLAHEKFSKGLMKVGVANVLVGVHHNDKAVALGNPGAAFGEEVIEKGLAWAFRKTSRAAKVAGMLLICRPGFLADTGPISGDNACAVGWSTFKKHPSPAS